MYTPPGYDADAGRRHPAIYMLQGLTGQLDMWRNRASLRKNAPELVDELFTSTDAPPCIDALQSMRAIYIDAGSRDQYYLDLGAFAFHRAVQEIGPSQVFFELFDAAHSAVEYRFAISLKYLAEHLA